MAGLPTAVRHLWRRNHNSVAAIRLAYTKSYWRPSTPMEAFDLALALVVWPIALLALSCLFLWKTGAAVALRSGRPLHLQMLDHLRLYAAAGILPPMYYVYELYQRPFQRHARSFLLRCETKGGVFHLLNREQRRADSVVSDKAAFATHFQKYKIPTVPTFAVFRSGKMASDFPAEAFRTDLFVKPVVAKGGRGAQRWDYIGGDCYQSSGGLILRQRELFDRWRTKSRRKPLLVQPRVLNHPDLQPLNNGALSTVRVLTCINEKKRPELVGAILRMAIGANHVIDNAHAGGIAAAVDLETGRVGPATDLGMGEGPGWIERHPQSNAQIEGVALPFWPALRSLVINAHSTVPGAVLLGWDVAITPNGPMLIEANGGPGLEAMQRAHRRGLGRERLGDLLAYHLTNVSREPTREAA